MRDLRRGGRERLPPPGLGLRELLASLPFSLVEQNFSGIEGCAPEAVCRAGGRRRKEEEEKDLEELDRLRRGLWRRSPEEQAVGQMISQNFAD